MFKNFLKLAAVSVTASLLTGCCITMPKFFTKTAAPKQTSPCATQHQQIYPAGAPDGCLVCYGDSGCCDENEGCAQPQTTSATSIQPAPIQEDYILLKAVPLHQYGWTPYQRRYGSAAPTIPAPVVIVPATRRITYR